MIFESVIPTNEQLEMLYAQLEKRSHSISHKEMPSFEEHEAFVRKHPYREWVIVKNGKRAIGNVYIQFDNSICIHLEPSDNFEQFHETMSRVYRLYSPLPAKPSVRIGEFFFRVPSGDHMLQEKLTSLGFGEVERTFIPLKKDPRLRRIKEDV